MSKGLAGVKTLTAKQIADKWKLPLAVIAKKIAAGVKVEKEHTTSLRQANEIARDHLGERPDYYEKIHKMEKTKIVKEDNATGAVRGLGYVTGDPGVNYVDQYVNTNALAYDPMNGAKLDFMRKFHNKLHKGLGFDEYNPTSKKLSEAKLNELGEYDNKGGSPGYEATSAPIRAVRKRDVEEQSPANISYKERPMYEKSTGNNPVPAGIERGIYEMDTAGFMSSTRSSKNIEDRRVGGGPDGISNTIKSFATNVALRQAGRYMQPTDKPAQHSILPKQSLPRAVAGAAIDTVKGAISSAKDTVGVGLDNPVKNIARTAVDALNPPGAKAAASAVYDKVNPAKPKVDLDKITVPKAEPLSSKAKDQGSTSGDFVSSSPTTPRSRKDSITTPVDDEHFNKNLDSQTPNSNSPLDGTEAPTTQRNNKSGKINEISAELVGKVSNARWRRGEAPSKTLTRAINKKFIETGKKKEQPKTVKEETKMDNRELINEALDCILEDNLPEMKENLMLALQEKAMEKLEERKKEIAANYFAQ